MVKAVVVLAQGDEVRCVRGPAVLPMSDVCTWSQRLRSQPGSRQPRSRPSTTMRVRSGTARKARPTFTGLPSASKTGRTRLSQLM